MTDKPLTDTPTNKGKIGEVGHKRPPVHSQFKKGQGGRPKGARNKLTRNYLKALHEDFKKHGKAALIKMREEKPEAYIAAVGKLVPKEVDLSSSDGTMTPQQVIYKLPDNGRSGT